tara:strand:+ start:1759 stop:2811 length:1053 start_codon:yes stop_codon:yes gene_type:complete
MPPKYSQITKDIGGYGGALVAGGGSAFVDMASGGDINPLLDITPTPFEGAMYGLAVINPIEGFSRLKAGLSVSGRGLAGKTAFSYSGAWGYKTLFSGVKAGSLWSSLSLGNVVLSAAQLTGKGLGSMGLAKEPLVKALMNARSTGIAGVTNAGFQVGPKDVIRNIRKSNRFNIGAHGQILKGKGIGGRGRGFKTAARANKAYKAAVRAGIQSAAAEGTAWSRWLYWLGGEGVGGAGAATIKAGAKMGIASRLALLGSGVGTAMIISDIASIATAPLISAAESGVTDLAATLFQWQKEIVKPEFGFGRLPIAMQSGAAATERQRAIRASYSAKINPKNRMMGNEASYHHSR